MTKKPPPTWIGGDAAEDETLVIRAQADPRAFAPLYARYVRPVYRYCYRRLGSHEAAEDATSQVFTKALTGLPGYRQGTFRGWLFAIANNVVTDAYRRHRPGVGLEWASSVIDQSPGPERIALAAEEYQTVQQLLAHLRPDQRRVVELRLAGLSGPEIAQALNRQPQAIKSLQFRAYTRLRRLLGIEVGRGRANGDEE